MIKVKKLHEEAVVPNFAYPTDSGADLYTCEDLELGPNGKGIAKTGIAIQLPEGFGATVRNKSGNSINGVCCKVFMQSLTGSFDEIVMKIDIQVLLGTVDNGYRGELGIMVKNNSSFHVTIPKGTKLAQLVLEQIYQEQFEVVDELEETERGEDGFGSTGN